MSSLLTLAKDLEQKSKAQQHDTGQMLKAAFGQHERYVSQELSASAERISAAIAAHEKGMTDVMRSNRLNVLLMTSRTWLTIVMVSVLLTATCGSVLWYLGNRITSNLDTLRQQEDALAKLTARTWGVSYQSDSNGQFLVLPKGTRAETDWTVDDGKRNAVKLIRE